VRKEGLVKKLLPLLLLVSVSCDLWKETEHSGLFVAKIGDKWGYINRSGAVAIAPQFTDARDFSEGLASVAIGDSWGVIDKSGAWVVNPHFIRLIGRFSEGMAEVRIKVTGVPQSGFINTKGDTVILPEFEEARAFSEGLAVVQHSSLSNGSGWSYMDRTGRLVGKFWFRPDDFHEGLGAVYDDSTGKWGYVDKSGRFAIAPQFSEARDFSEGLAAVLDGDSWGYINRSGTFVVGPRYRIAGSFANGLAPVSDWTNESPRYIKTDGGLVLPPPQCLYADEFSRGMAAVYINGHWGFIDQSLKVVIAATFLSVEPFSDGLAYVTDERNRGYINKAGKYVWAE